MRAITDYKAISAYRARRKSRLDGRRLDDEWKTVKGTHVLIDDGGTITGGPERLRNYRKKTSSADKTVRAELKPARDDYDFSDTDSKQSWVHKNVQKLMPVFEDGGSEAVDAEWRKFRMQKSTGNIHEISRDEAESTMYDNVSQSTFDGWYRNADSTYKPALVDAVTKNEEMRNAALNMAYENYKASDFSDKPKMSFEEFLTTPIKMYRGVRGQKPMKEDVFDAFTLDKKIAQKFAGDDGEIVETEIRPIDTYGCMREVGELEIWVPREVSPIKVQKDSRDDSEDTSKYDPIAWEFEDYEDAIRKSSYDNAGLIEEIIQEAEILKLFAVVETETNKQIVERCIDSMQRLIKHFTMNFNASNADSAFFAGELQSNLGERVNIYPEQSAQNKGSEGQIREDDAIARFRERRDARLLEKANKNSATAVDNQQKCGKIRCVENEDGFDENLHPRDESGQFSNKGSVLPPIPNKTLVEAIKSGKISTKVDSKKQSKHRKGTAAYNKAVSAGRYVSYLEISDSEIQKIVKEKAGTGNAYGNGVQFKETVDVGKKSWSVL